MICARMIWKKKFRHPGNLEDKGGGLFLFTHLTVERCPFLFIYLTWKTFRRVGNLETYVKTV